VVAKFFGPKLIEKLWKSATFTAPQRKAVEISAKKISEKYQIESLEFVITQKIFDENFPTALIGKGFIAARKKWIKAIENALKKETTGIDPLKRNQIANDFILICQEELARLENVSIIQMEYLQAIHADQKNLSDKIDSLNNRLPSSTAQLLEENQSVIAEKRILVSPSVEPASTMLGRDGIETELNNSLYKAKLDALKILLEKEQFVVAKDEFEKMLGSFNGSEPLLARFKVFGNLGVCYMNVGNKKMASEYFKKAYEAIRHINILPYKVIACKNRAVAALIDGVGEEGLSYLEEAKKLDPQDKEIINLQVSLLIELDRGDEALESYGTDK
jgi:tetratricopeptide (TPR) repeat protein